MNVHLLNEEYLPQHTTQSKGKGLKALLLVSALGLLGYSQWHSTPELTNLQLDTSTFYTTWDNTYNDYKKSVRFDDMIQNTCIPTAFISYIRDKYPKYDPSALAYLDKYLMGSIGKSPQSFESYYSFTNGQGFGTQVQVKTLMEDLLREKGLLQPGQENFCGVAPPSIVQYSANYIFDLDELSKSDVQIENYGLQAMLRSADVTGLSLTPTFVKDTTKWRIEVEDKASGKVRIRNGDNLYIGVNEEWFGTFDKQPASLVKKSATAPLTYWIMSAHTDETYTFELADKPGWFLTGDGGCMGSVFITKAQSFGFLWHVHIPKEDCYHKIEVDIVNPFVIFDCCEDCSLNQKDHYKQTVIVKPGTNDLFTFSRPSTQIGKDIQFTYGVYFQQGTFFSAYVREFRGREKFDSPKDYSNPAELTSTATLDDKYTIVAVYKTKVCPSKIDHGKLDTGKCPDNGPVLLDTTKTTL